MSGRQYGRPVLELDGTAPAAERAKRRGPEARLGVFPTFGRYICADRIHEKRIMVSHSDPKAQVVVHALLT